MEIIAHIINDMKDKFGIPRQSGIVNDLLSTIVFEPKYRNMDALRGLEGFSYIWLLWEFESASSNNQEWSPTVRPPRLGGNTRMGVFATRSPNRPNPIGLSCVKIVDISDSSNGPVITVAGADLRSGTGIYDIKPYLAFADSHPDATGGFAADYVGQSLDVVFPDSLISILPEAKRKTAVSLLSQDPRPSYHNDPERIYGMSYSGYNIQFTVSNNTIYVVAVSSSSTTGSS